MDANLHQGPPYPPQGAGLGGIPNNQVDTPISAVIIALFIGSAVFNMTIFQKNRRRGHKFVLSALLFGFSMARIATNVMRIVWANRQHNTQIAIAATILTNAGVLLLFIVNLILAQRVVRALHPSVGWAKFTSLAFKALYVFVVCMLIMVITSGVYTFYTLDPSILTKLRDIQLFAVTFLSVLAFLPVPILLAAILLPQRAGEHPVDHFGSGTLRTKVILVLFTSVLLAMGAGFRAAVAYEKRAANHPAWFDSKACYYCFNFTIELIVVYTYALSRFDRRFHVPDGSSAPGHYSRGVNGDKDAAFAAGGAPLDEERPPTQAEEREKERQWESNLQNELSRRESTAAS